MEHAGPYSGVPSHGAAQPAGRSDLGMLQAQLNQLANQIGMPVGGSGQSFDPYGSMVGGTATPHNNAMRQSPVDPTAEILRRQQMLNGAAHEAAQYSAKADAQRQEAENQISTQLDELKKEINGIKAQVSKPIAVQQSVSQQEIDKIAGAIAELQAQKQPSEDAFDQLTKELDQLRNSMRKDMKSAVSVMRSDIKKSSEPQDEKLSERFDTLSRDIDRLSVQSANDMSPRVDKLAQQLDSLRMTVDDLPQTLAISRLEERLTEITEKVESIGANVSQPTSLPETAPSVSNDQLESLEGRLDEIARALVAVSNSNSKAAVPEPVDLSAIDRVEARMSDLARTLDSLAEQNTSDELTNLGVRIDGLTDRLGSFEKYAEAGDLGGANAMFAAPDTGVIEDQLRALNAQIEEASMRSQTGALEEQIQRLTMRVEEAANVNSTAAQMSNLEAQIGQIIRHLNKQDGGVAVDFSPVEARLGQIESQLMSNQNFSLEAAQQAAQQAVSMMGPQSESGQIIDALSKDLRALQEVAEGGNASNAQTVAHVQQTLQQVVERLGAIEGAIEEVAARPATVVSEPAPMMPAASDLQTGTPVDEASHNRTMEELSNQTTFAADTLIDAAGKPTPGPIQQAAIDAGYSAPISDSDQHSVQSNLKVDPPNLDPTEHLENQYGQSSDDNTPLEPGTAAPDLEELVKKASEKLDATKATMSASSGMRVADDNRDGEDIRPDAVAAARRALQATTVEMNAVREEVAEGKSSSAVGGLKAKIQKMLPSLDGSRLRKPLVLGAAALLLAIVAFKGIGMIAGGQSEKVANLETPAVETVEKTTADPASPALEDRVVREVTADDNLVVTNPDAETMEVVSEPVVEPGVETPVANNDVLLSDEPSDANTVVPASTPSELTTPVEAVDISTTEPEIETVEAPQEAETARYDVPASAGPAALIAAASSGDPKALFQLGMRYSEGDDVKRNMTESARWFRHSAETGFAPAQYSVGSLYEKGIGVERDVNKAAEWYEKAAAQGNARAMHNLAVIHAMGNPPSIQPNMDNAVGWFQQAAAYGIKDSQFNLGILYGQGMGVPQNLADSYKWFALAAKTGDTDASKKRDEVANAMDPDDLDEARREVNNWVPKKLNEAANRVAVPEEWRGKSRGGDTARTERTSATSPTQVKLAQNLLNQRGFNVGTPDGLIGPKTKRAIMEFQRSAGIPVTGKVDKKLLQALDLQT